MSSALAYFDGYKSERLPSNLLQAQRDYFGAHTYERIDKERGYFFIQIGLVKVVKHLLPLMKCKMNRLLKFIIIFFLSKASYSMSR